MKIPNDLTTPEAVHLLDALTDDDQEQSHMDADRIVETFLRSQGHVDVANAFDRARKRVSFLYA